MVYGTIVSPLGIALKTTKETSIRDQYGNQVLQETYVYTGMDYERIAWTAMDYDDRGHVVLSRNHKGESMTAVWTGEQKTSETASSGIETTYTYDPLNRIKTQTKKGVAAGGGFSAQADLVTSFEYDADGRQTSVKLGQGTGGLISSRAYDKAGRVIREIDPAGLTTTYHYSNGSRTQKVYRPGGSTEISDHYVDGQSKSISGTSVVERNFDYGVNLDGTRSTQEFVGSSGLSSPRWTKTTTNWIGRTIAVEKPSFTGKNVVETSVYNSLGQLQRQKITADNTQLIAEKLYEYDERGELIRSGSDVDGDGTLTLVSTDPSHRN
jgi:YD repeat-containing protein